MSILLARSWIRRKILVGGALASVLLAVAIAIVLYSDALPRPVVIGLFAFEAIAALAFITLRLEY